MKRIVLAAITCLSLLAALPALSAAHPSGHDRGRDHRGGDRGRDHRSGDRDRPGDHDRGDRPGDRARDGRMEHFRAQDAGTAGVVQSLRNGLLTIKLAGGSTPSGRVTPGTRLGCEAMDRDFGSHEGGPGSSDCGANDDIGRSDHGGRRDSGDRRDRRDREDRPNTAASCLAMLQRPGTAVRDAELHVSGGDAVWEEVELGR